MNARLGFAIAAHLDPEVLIIDEVLAVGDADFQGRAFARIREMVKTGIPVLVVSHQLDRISELCTSALLLERGQVVFKGPPDECIRHYIQPTPGPPNRAGQGEGRIRELEFPDGTRVRSGERLRLRVTAVRTDGGAEDDVDPLGLLVRDTQSGAVVAGLGSHTCGITLPSDGGARIETSLQMNVPPGVYMVETLVWDRKASLALEQGPAAAIVVEEGSPFSGYVQLNAEMRITRTIDDAARLAVQTPDPRP
jgi:hypothetical protein